MKSVVTYMHTFSMKIMVYNSLASIFLIIFLFCLFPSLARADANISGNVNIQSTYKYPYVHYDDVVFTDFSRLRNGAIYTGTPVVPPTGFRLIDVRIYRPALSPGNGSPLAISWEPIVYNGTYPNYPLVTTDMKAYLDHTWADNAIAPGPFPLIVMFGGGGSSMNVLKLAEEIASAGFIVAVPSGYGVDTSTCPTPSFCTAAVARTQPRDGRVVIDAAQNNLLGFPNTDITHDSSGLPIVGMVAGSLGANVAVQSAAGYISADANSLPGELAPDPRIRAVFAGDTYTRPMPGVFDPAQYTAALGVFNSGLSENWPNDFSRYSNAKTRIFYQLTNREHRGSDLGGNMICNIISENIRVYQNGINTARDNALLSGPVGLQQTTFANAFAHCSQADLVGFQSLPLTSPLFPSSLADLISFAPLTGVSDINTQNSDESDFDSMSSYYASNFMLAMLNGDSNAYTRATTPSFRGLIDQIYVDGVPGIEEHDFNLQNKQIDIKLVKGKYITAITDRTGDIPDPSTAPNAVSVFGNATWDDSISTITPMFSFPFMKGNLISSSNSVAIQSNGYVLPESYMSTVDGLYAGSRLGRWFEDRGSTTIALLGADLKSQATLTASNPAGKIWVSSTPDRLQITWYKVLAFEFPAVTAISAQVTLFPDGSIRLEYDNSIPAVIPPNPGLTDSILVGLSSGRLHVNGAGKYIATKNASVTSFTDVMNGQSTKNADAIYEVYTIGIPAHGNQPSN